MSQPIDTHLNAGATCAIFEGVDPVSADLGHLRAYGSSHLPIGTYLLRREAA